MARNAGHPLNVKDALGWYTLPLRDRLRADFAVQSSR